MRLGALLLSAVMMRLRAFLLRHISSWLDSMRLGAFLHSAVMMRLGDFLLRQISSARVWLDATGGFSALCCHDATKGGQHSALDWTGLDWAGGEWLQ
jgi:hypothetical protein